MQKNDSNPQVRELKEALFARGYLKKIPTHNVFGIDTQKALIEFQKDHGLIVSGTCDDRLLEFIKGASTAESQIDRDIFALIEQVKHCVGGFYIFGAQGNELTPQYVKQQSVAHPKMFGLMPDNSGVVHKEKFEWAMRQAGQKDQNAWDCSGLYCDAVNKGKFMPKHFDSPAHVIYYDYCVPIARSELRPGDLVFRKKSKTIVHMGIVGYNGVVYEAAGLCYGVVQQDSVNDRRTYNKMTMETDRLPMWTHYGRPEIFIKRGKTI